MAIVHYNGFEIRSVKKDGRWEHETHGWIWYIRGSGTCNLNGGTVFLDSDSAVEDAKRFIDQLG